MKLNSFKLKMNEYLRVMWGIFHRYEIKGLIEVDEMIARSAEDILRMLKCH